MAAALIIGANSGVGSACAQLFVRNNWHVTATYHCRSDRIDALRSNLPRELLKVVQLDVLNENGFVRLHDTLPPEFKDPTALVFNASFADPTLWNAMPLAISDRTLQTSFAIEVAALHNVLRALVDTDPARPLSTVVFSSASAIHGDPDTFAFNVAKYALVAYVRMLASKYGDRLRINCIAPDSIATDWLTTWSVTDAELDSFRVMRSGSRRLGSPEEVAELVLFLCGPGAAFLNGQTIMLDGGAT